MTSKAGKKPRTHYNLNNFVKKQNKPKEWLNQKASLEKRKETEGETKWLVNAIKIVDERLKKAGLLK